MLNLDSCNDSDCDLLIQHVARKFSPLFRKRNYTDEDKRSIYRYFFSQRPKKLPPSLKSRIINLYDPLADRTKRFPDGLRFCLNVYVGCEHACKYCYVNGYSQESVGHSPHVKSDFRKNLVRDMNDCKEFAVPVAPLHLSNSTDICQETLETQYRHTLFALNKISEYRDHFSSVVLLTKNPKILCQEEYLSLLNMQSMKPLVVQVTCAFWCDEVRKFYEPDAPTIESRLQSITFLIENNIDIEMRIDPLFPSSGIEFEEKCHKPLPDYSLPETQSHDDLVQLVRFAKNTGVKTIIGKPLKIPISNKAEKAKNLFGELFRESFTDRTRTVQGGSWRLPETYQESILSSVATICKREGIRFKFCKYDVLTRK
ncbi:MAG: hypothetical protein D8M57_16665 [Candidatus Scalindua sp. AMX11]|nr:MAG: hypothetical protein DWQ00_06680 [Candidatus Scalindua sp.]NOG84249.1 hypothetical protein [Planctomycetota bacterium]RZV68282.1 MAG: hypothetical protein EX341_16560 [Candidatus Scalindua sp. SCAELEC01]TDE63772.1 MAG: hypothetical protein D8M57_16665 [Candidatus Scalindua sp. AMX11]GJQ60726.1 MAG: radical SAM protein [Candidatus Scalindua sp.]